jgi:hypothetical protein
LLLLLLLLVGEGLIEFDADLASIFFVHLVGHFFKFCLEELVLGFNFFDDDCGVFIFFV